MKEPGYDRRFENALRDKADGFEPEPSDEVWQKVNRGVARRRRRGMLFWGLSVMAGLLLLAGGYYLLNPQGRQPASITTTVTETTIQPQTSAAPEEKTVPEATAQTNTAPSTTQPRPAQATTSIAHQTANTAVGNPQSFTVTEKPVQLKSNKLGYANPVKEEKLNKPAENTIATTEPEEAFAETATSSTANEASTTPAEVITTETAAIETSTVQPNATAEPNLAVAIITLNDTLQPTTMNGVVKDTTLITERKRRWSLGAVGSADNTFRQLNSTSPATDSVKQRRDRQEIPMMGFHAGVAVRYAVSKRFALQAGFEWTRRGMKTIPNTIMVDTIIQQPVNTTTGYGPTTKVTAKRFADSSISYTYIYQHIELPVLVQYTFGQRKLKGFISAGVAPGLLMSYKESAYVTHNNTVTKTPVTNTSNGYSFDGLGMQSAAESAFNVSSRSFSLDARLQAGIEYHFTKRFYAQLSPVFHYGLLTATKDPTLKEHLRSTGLGAGVFFRL